MNRYLLKVNGETHCPHQTCRPKTAADWEGGEILIPKRNPSRWTDGKLQSVPKVDAGDELWIWTHEYGGHGDGWGLTAIALAGPNRETDRFLAIQLLEVERILHPFGFLDLDDGPTGSRVLDAAKARRDHRAWFLDDNDYQEVIDLVERRGAQTPADVSEEIEKRRLNGQKQRPAQGRFRRDILDEYNGTCVLTGCSTLQALEAAHVLPHDGSSIRDQATNGLLLRRDLHSMFDAVLWSIDPESSEIRLSNKVTDPTYTDLDGTKVEHSVVTKNLAEHFEAFMHRETNA